MLSSREKNIISYLLKDKGFITIKELSNLFHLSERSIQYDLENIEYYAEEQGAEVLRNKRSGVKLIYSPAFEKQLSDEQEIETTLSPDERKERILIILFETLKPVSSNQFAKHLSVTRRTIVEDMKEVQTWLQTHSLELEYTKNKGFRIQ